MRVARIMMEAMSHKMADDIQAEIDRALGPSDIETFSADPGFVQIHAPERSPCRYSVDIISTLRNMPSECNNPEFWQNIAQHKV